MTRIEIIANHSVEENILEALAKEQVGKYYTKYPNILGVGSSGPRMGDAVWPEENFSLVIYCDSEEVRGIQRAVGKVKQQFPDEGIKLFGIGILEPKVQSPAAPQQIPGQPQRTGSLIKRFLSPEQLPAPPEQNLSPPQLGPIEEQ